MQWKKLTNVFTHRHEYIDDNGKLIRCWVCAFGCLFHGHSVCWFYHSKVWACVYCRKVTGGIK